MPNNCQHHYQVKNGDDSTWWKNVCSRPSTTIFCPKQHLMDAKHVWFAKGIIKNSSTIYGSHRVQNLRPTNLLSSPIELQFPRSQPQFSISNQRKPIIVIHFASQIIQQLKHIYPPNRCLQMKKYYYDQQPNIKTRLKSRTSSSSVTRNNLKQRKNTLYHRTYKFNRKGSIFVTQEQKSTKGIQPRREKRILKYCNDLFT